MKLPLHPKKVFKKFTLFTQKSNSAQVLLPEIFIGTILTSILLTIFFYLATLVQRNEFNFFDERIITILYSLRSPFLTHIMSLFTFFGGKIFIGSTIVAIIFYLMKRHTIYAYLFAFVLFTGIGVNLFLKNLYERPRPFLDPLVFEATYSFPSGHSMNSFIFYATIAFFIYRKSKNKNIGFVLVFLFSLIVVTIGVSRIYLGAHYPSDVIAGWVAGCCWFVLMVLFEKLLTITMLYKSFRKKSK